MSENIKKILVIEDDKSLNEALGVKLTREGFEVISAKDGEEGLKTAINQHPDLILLDIIMPKMDGIAMLKKLREDNWGKTAKVVILTNLSSEEAEAEGNEKDANLYLIKSNTKIDEVVEKVREVLL